MAPSFQRARSPEHKQQRREAILRAARSLAEKRGVRAVGLSDVARDVGLAKSNVLRYFETREEIFLHLTVAAWREWADELARQLAKGADAPAVAAILARTLEERPLFCDLLAHTPSNLEHNVSLAAVRSYKRAVLPIVDEVAGLCAETLPELEGDGFEPVAMVTTLAPQLWQIANPPAVLAELYTTDPEFAGACPPFEPTLRAMTARFLAGYSSPGEGPELGRQHGSASAR